MLNGLRRLTSLAMAWAAMAVVAVVPPAMAEGGNVKIGMAIAQSGWMTAFDEDPSMAVRMAVKDINAKGGILGRQVELLVADTKTDPTQAAKVGTELVDQGIDFMIVSCDFDMGAPAALAAQNAGILAMSICSGSPKWGPQGVGPLVYTISVAVQAESYLLAEWAKNKKGWNSAYALKETDYTYTRAECSGFQHHWKELPGTKFLGEDTYKVADTSIAVQITRIKALPEKPDVILLCSTVTAMPSIIRQLRAAGITTPLMTSMGADGDYWLPSLPDLSDFYLPVHASIFGDDPNPDVRAFMESFEKANGRRPTSSFALMGYSLMQGYQRAVERAGTTDSEAVAAELNKFKDEPLLIGPRSFTPDIHIQTRVRGLMMEVQNGKMKSTGEYYMNETPVPFEVLFSE
ncbi:ABC transporter substrate-binding protein [Propylenella binzhouense]|uniref:ABC transporter substrate-binding protein n=1 Tax=Propylenella binzhouense TaxID=2555902 RepID=A0A964T0U7_9HYPH|nr:ABC transporter substrate-binding protein [Propylenella binzhouense]MYZ46240.1 ABC transporter substrate-binding protein [Propylenella binzhouense]